jgi:hypothetical protein
MTRDAAKSASKIVQHNNNNNNDNKTAHFNLSKFRAGQQFVTRLLLFLTISFFFSTLPSTIVYAFWHSEVTKHAHGRIILNLLNTLQFFRHSSNWIIYVYSSSFMREEMKKCVACADTEYELAAAQAAVLGEPNRRRPTLQLLRQLEQLNKHPNGTVTNDNYDDDDDDDDFDTNMDSANVNTSVLMNNPNLINSMLCNDPDLYFYYLYYNGKQNRAVETNGAKGQSKHDDQDKENEQADGADRDKSHPDSESDQKNVHIKK